MTKRNVMDGSPYSDFVSDMRAAFARRLAASGATEKREIEREMKRIMRRYLGRSAWDAAGVDPARTIVASVPRDTSPDPACHETTEPIDRKTLAAGPESE